MRIGVNAPGLHGSIWRTDLWLYADTLGGHEVSLKLCRSGQDNTAAQTFTVTAAPGQMVVSIEDVVDHFLSLGGGSWVGAIHYTANVPLQADGRFRVNVGVVNPTPVGGRFWVSMFDEFGNHTDATVELQLDAYSMVQLSDPFASVDGGDWSEKQIRVGAEAEDSGAFGYISVVDNATNDAYFVRGIKTMEFPAP